jgi:hypothetical protein
MGIHDQADELLVTLLAQGEEYLLATAVAEAINRSVENITEALLSAEAISQQLGQVRSFGGLCDWLRGKGYKLRNENLAERVLAAISVTSSPASVPGRSDFEENGSDEEVSQTARWKLMCYQD